MIRPILIVPSLAALLVIGGCTQDTSTRSVASAPAAQSLAPSVAAVYPALVQIYVITTMPEGGRLAKEQIAGSGVIISTDGHVVTNHHVVGHAVAVRCRLADRREVEADVVGSDALCDIAVLRLRLPAGVPVPAVASWGDSSALQIGTPVYAMGCPLALAQSVTVGIVSNTAMSMPKFLGGTDAFKLDGEAVGSMVAWIMHDAVIFPGNSGGPLINGAGQVVGINEIGIGLGGAIPSAVARPVAEALIKAGSVQRAWFGFDLRPLFRDASATEVGVLIADVRAGSPAAAAGLRTGDRLLSVAGTAVTARHDEDLPGVMRLLVAQPIGVACELVYARGGEQHRASLVALKRDLARGEDREVPELGLFARRLTRDEAAEQGMKDGSGALIGGLRSGGPAASALPPLQTGDVILTIDGAPVADAEALSAACARRGQAVLLLTVARHDERLVSRVEAGLRQPPTPPAGPHRAHFPATVQAVTPPLAQALGLPAVRGVRITGLLPGAPAGLQVGDVVTKVDDQLLDVRSAQDVSVFRDLISAYDPGARVAVSVQRTTGVVVVDVLLPARPKSGDEIASYHDYRLEFTVRDCTYDDRRRLFLPSDLTGAFVVDAASCGWAAVGGLRADDVIVQVDGVSITSAADLKRVLAATPTSRRISAFTVQRGISTHIIEIERPAR